MDIFVTDAQPWDQMDPAIPKFDQYPPERPNEEENMPKVTPSLWFDNQAEEALRFLHAVKPHEEGRANPYHSMTVLAQVRPPPNTTIRT